LLIALGVLGLAVGGFIGCGSLFTWSGRHPIDTYDLTLGTLSQHAFAAKGGRRYTAAVQVVFDRSAATPTPGGVEVEAALPLVAAIVDQDGNPSARVTGWLDPSEPPTVLHGRSLPNPSPTANAPSPGRQPPELVAERLIGPWRAPRTEQARIDVRLGPDEKNAGAVVTSARVVLYDDAIPPSILAGAVAASVGGLALAVGIVLGIVAFARRGGIRRRQIV